MSRGKLFSNKGPEAVPTQHKSGESNRPLTLMLLKSIAIHLPFLSQYFCRNMPSSWQKVVYIYIQPSCISMPMICLQFVSRCLCRSIRVRGRWNTPKIACGYGCGDGVEGSCGGVGGFWSLAAQDRGSQGGMGWTHTHTERNTHPEDILSTN